jgi:Raf kinase inhibitor-like YbhB/YbcL family protein
LIVDDPDAPGKTWVHWTAWNINPGIREIPEGEVPAGAVEGLTDFGTVGWGGPCPPPGRAHHYRFRAYALSSRLPLAAGAAAPELVRAMEGKVLARAEWVGTYARTR